jgi:ComF family protein
MKSGICEECRDNPPPFLSAKAWALYLDPLRKAIHSFKYNDNTGLARFFSSQLIKLISNSTWQFDLIVPIPLSRAHLKTRGYNQSEKLAIPLSNYFQIPLVNDAISRIKETQSQFNLDRTERFKNVEGAFWGNPATLKNKKVLLVDDIFTTGATMRSCSKAILEAGGEAVFCITVAQTNS